MAEIEGLSGTSAHITGPAEWQKRIASGEFKTIMMEEA